MAEQTSENMSIGHPAPLRGRVSRSALYIGLALGAFSWFGQLCANSAVAWASCETFAHREWSYHWAGSWPVIIGFNVLALVLSALGLALGAVNLSKTGEEEEQQPGGIMDAGEGRTRFLSTWGIWASLLFFLAIAFNTISLFWGGLCTV